MATGRAGYVRPVSGARPGRVVTQGDDHPGESAAARRGRRQQSARHSGEPSRGRGWLDRGHEAAAAGDRGQMTAPGCTGIYFPLGPAASAAPGASSSILRGGWHDNRSWPR